MPTPYETQLSHLIRLASDPGFKDHAWHQAKQLEACSSGLFQNLSTDLKAAMLARQSPRSSDALKNTGS